MEYERIYSKYKDEAGYGDVKLTILYSVNLASVGSIGTGVKSECGWLMHECVWWV